MKVLAIVASPRQNGNVDTLVQEVLKGAEESGSKTETYYLNKMKYSDCQACMYCKSHDSCRLDDDMSGLIEAMKDADAVVFGTPIYYFQFNGQFRMFMDRLYRYLGLDFKVSLPAGKKAVVITSQGNPDTKMFDGVFQDFDRVLKMYGFSSIGALHMVGGNSPSAVMERKDLLTEARSLGREL